eukprot:2950325-Amphidinium_carterae.2
MCSAYSPAIYVWHEHVFKSRIGWLGIVFSTPGAHALTRPLPSRISWSSETRNKCVNIIHTNFGNWTPEQDLNMQMLSLTYSNIRHRNVLEGVSKTRSSP